MMYSLISEQVKAMEEMEKYRPLGNMTQEKAGELVKNNFIAGMYWLCRVEMNEIKGWFDKMYLFPFEEQTMAHQMSLYVRLCTLYEQMDEREGFGLDDVYEEDDNGQETI